MILAAVVGAISLFAGFVALIELAAVGAAESWSDGVHGKRHPEDMGAIKRSGVEQMEARQPHKLEVAGSSPAPVTTLGES